MKHQLNIHLDYGIQCVEVGGLEVRYGYHYSREHQLREQVIQIPAAKLDPDLKSDLDAVYEMLRIRIPHATPIRLPHAEIVPTVRPGGLTFVVLDQAREEQLPIARLYYYEIVETIRSNIERRVYLQRPDWTEDELKVGKRVREKVRKIAWDDYTRLMGHHLFGAAERES